MSGNEKFCLRWNDFESNISLAFREIREEKDFFDCTLSCGARQIQAHKLILSACSPFFRSILKQNPHQHPLLYLKGVEFTNLQSVLNFMYHGEVNVAQEELNSFLAVAEDLQVKGLTQNISNKPSAPVIEKTAPTPIPKQRPPKPSPKPPSQRERPALPPPCPAYQSPSIQEVSPVVKTEPESHAVSYNSAAEDTQSGVIGVETMEEGFGDGEFEYEEYEGGQYGYDGGQGVEVSQGVLMTDPLLQCTEDKIVDNIVEDHLGFKCGLCGRGFGSNKSHCKRHIKNVHSKTSSALFCDFCQKSYKNYDTLKAHQRATHGVYSNE